MKIALIGNCQTQSIAAVLGRAIPDASIAQLDFSNADMASSDARASYAENLSSADVILTHWTKFDHINTEALKLSHGEKVHVLGNFLFRGLHPDVCYLQQTGEHGAKLAGYHSWTILASYLRGQSQEEAVANFNPRWFKAERLLLPWSDMVAEIGAYDRIADTPLTETITSLSLKQKTFHTINHPTLSTLAVYIQKAIGHLWDHREIDIDGLTDPLTFKMMIPVHDFVAEHYGLQFRTPQTWSFSGGNHSLDSMVEKYYRRYDAAQLRDNPPAVTSPAALRDLTFAASPYKGRPPHTHWKTGVNVPGPVAPPSFYKRRWPIERTDQIATAGSCFAQHIGRNLRKFGFGVMDMEPAPADLDPSLHAKCGYGIFSGRYGNIYTARQLLQLAEEAFDERPTPDHIAWRATRGGGWIDALRPNVEPNGLGSAEAVFDHRVKHVLAVRRLFSDMDILIFTLGLTEAWGDIDGTIFATAPGTIGGSFDADRHRFHNFTVAQIRSDIEAFMDLMSRHRQKPLRYLFTVSPVPLVATAADSHVMVATTQSKAILRAAASEIVAAHPEADYFPSFEIIANPWNSEPFYEADLRNISKRGVDTVMKVFSEAHLGSAPQKRTEPPRPVAAITTVANVALEEPDDAVICEDARLDVFAVQSVDLV